MSAADAKMFSWEAVEKIANMLNGIEKGDSWPKGVPTDRLNRPTEKENHRTKRSHTGSSA